jgi:hypothetical protein
MTGVVLTDHPGHGFCPVILECDHGSPVGDSDAATEPLPGTTGRAVSYYSYSHQAITL